MVRCVQTGIKLAGAQQQLKALAERRGVSPADCIQKFSDTPQPFVEGDHGIDFACLLTILDFTSLALDTLIHRYAPENSDRLLDVAVVHAKICHAS